MRLLMSFDEAIFILCLHLTFYKIAYYGPVVLRVEWMSNYQHLDKLLQFGTMMTWRQRGSKTASTLSSSSFIHCALL